MLFLSTLSFLGNHYVSISDDPFIFLFSLWISYWRLCLWD